MKAAKGLETSRESGDVHLLESAQRQLDALRAAIDARLAELDAALADPARASSLTGLILELSRLATAEAQATATRACLQIKSDGEASILEAEARNLAAVEVERKAASALRKNLDRTQKTLDLVESEKHAVLQAAREQTQLLEAERSSRGDLDRALAKLEQQVADAQAQTVEADEAAERATIERTHALERVAGLEQQLATAQQHLSAERHTSEALRQEQHHSVERIATLEGQLEASTRRVGEVEQHLTATRAAATSLEAELATAGDRVAGLELELEAARETVVTEREAARTAAEQRAYAETRLHQLEQQLAERAKDHDQLRTDLDAARAALAQATQADEMQRQAMLTAESQLVTERQARSELLAQIESLTGLLDAERGVTTDLRHAISAATSAVDGEQHAVTTLRQVAADAEQRATDLRAAHATAQSAHDAAAQALDLERQRAADLERQYTELERAHGDLQQTHASLAQQHGDLEQTHATLSQAHADLERTSASLHRDLDAQRAASGDADSGLRAELEQTRQDAASTSADLTAVQQRLASLEQARAQAEETAVDAGERVAIVERERDALSLALDTERMTTSDLRDAVRNADRQIADMSGQLEELRQQVATLRTAPPSAHTQATDGGDSDVAELTFDEDRVDEPGDGAITLEEEGWESVRLSTRYTFTSPIDVKVNGVTGVLCDLSVGGCGVRTTATLETGDTVRVQLPQDPHTLLCLGQVVWVRKEPASGRTRAGTRAGIQFTQADEGALEAFIITRADV